MFSSISFIVLPFHLLCVRQVPFFLHMIFTFQLELYYTEEVNALLIHRTMHRTDHSTVGRSVYYTAHEKGNRDS